MITWPFEFERITHHAEPRRQTARLTTSSLWTEQMILELGLILVLAGCGGLRWMSPDTRFIPDDPGLYIYQNTDGSEDLRRLDGDSAWELQTWPSRSNFRPDIEFVVYQPSLSESGSSLEQAVKLRRVAWLRSEISDDWKILPIDGGRWVVTGLESHEVPLYFLPVDAHADIVRAVPRQPLGQGLYDLEYTDGDVKINARFGIGWPAVDERIYAATTCVDRYRGKTPHYRRCAEQAQALATPRLKLYLVSPDVEFATHSRALVIKGVVVNPSDRYRTVPLLEAQVRAQTGEILQRWRFDAGITGLPPDQSAAFYTIADNPPPNAYSVHVRFAVQHDAAGDARWSDDSTPITDAHAHDFHLQSIDSIRHPRGFSM